VRVGPVLRDCALFDRSWEDDVEVDDESVGWFAHDIGANSVRTWWFIGFGTWCTRRDVLGLAYRKLAWVRKLIGLACIAFWVHCLLSARRRQGFHLVARLLLNSIFFSFTNLWSVGFIQGCLNWWWLLGLILGMNELQAEL